MDMDNLIKRGIRAYARESKRHNVVVEQASRQLSTAEMVTGRPLVIIRNRYRTLAIYRTDELGRLLRHLLIETPEAGYYVDIAAPDWSRPRRDIALQPLCLPWRDDGACVTDDGTSFDLI